MNGAGNADQLRYRHRCAHGDDVAAVGDPGGDAVVTLVDHGACHGGMAVDRERRGVVEQEPQGDLTVVGIAVHRLVAAVGRQ